MLYVADSAYLAGKNSGPEFEDYTGLYLFYDLTQSYQYGVWVEEGVPVGQIMDVQRTVTSNAVHPRTNEQSNTQTGEGCVEFMETIFIPCGIIAAYTNCFDIQLINVRRCLVPGGTISQGGNGSAPTGPGNVTGPGGSGNGWPSGNTSNNGTNTGGIANEVQALLWQIYSGSVPIDALNYYSAIGTYLPSGLTFARISMLVEIQRICKFTNAERHLLDWLQYNPSHISKIHAFVTKHDVEPPPLEAGSEYVPNMNDKVVAVAVTKAYIQMLKKNSHEMQEMLSNIEGLQVGDPLLDMIAEQLAEALKALLIDLIPGGTFVTSIPVIVQHFENGDILEGIWECVTTMLDEGQRALPVLKAANLTIGIVQIADKMSDFYQVIKKAEKLGGDVAYKIYQVLRNRLDGLYTKMKWGGNSVEAKITGAGDPLDVWDDFIKAFDIKPGDISGGNGNELVATFYLGGSKYEIKFYPVSSSTGEPTISFTKGSIQFKLRF